MFALIAELSSSRETWEIQFQADLAPDRLLSHTLSRHRSIVAHEQQVVPHSGDAAGSKGPELPVQDLDTSEGKNDFRRAMCGVKPTDVFAEIGAGPDGRARASIVQRNPRRVLAEAAGADERLLRAALREAIPKLIFTVSRRVPILASAGTGELPVLASCRPSFRACANSSSFSGLPPGPQRSELDWPTCFLDALCAYPDQVAQASLLQFATEHLADGLGAFHVQGFAEDLLRTSA